jgi:hypothetical protein
MLLFTTKDLSLGVWGLGPGTSSLRIGALGRCFRIPGFMV